MKFELLVDNEEKVFTGEQIIEAVKNIIKEDMYMEQDEQGYYHSDIYVDYRDGLHEGNLKDIAQAKNKMEAFYDTMDDFVTECIMYEEGEFMSTVYRNWDDDTFGEFYEYEDFIRDWMFDNVYFNFPYDHYLKETVQVNLVVDTGDGGYDYTLNNFLSYNASEDEYKEIEEESSILWLVKQQGYTEEDLIRQIEDGTESKFLQSVENELENCSSHMNALTFFVSMSLKEFIEMESAEYIRLDKHTSVGLMDYWMGAGSLLEISLEKPVELDMKLVEPHIDGARGYGVDEVYGMFSDFWSDTLVEMLIDGEWA